MRKSVCRTFLIIGCVCCMATWSFAQGPGALTWTLEGTSGFVTDGQKHARANRMMFSDAAIDDAGRIFTTANIPTNLGAPHGAVTIYEPDGSGGWIVTDVDLDAAGYPGVVTKLVNVSGKIYALQNFYWVEWWESDQPTWWGTDPIPIPELNDNDRILRVNPDGTVDLIIDNGQDILERIVDIAPSYNEDGYIYMTMNGDNTDFFRRVDPSGPGPYSVESSAHTGDGWGTNHSVRDLVPVGPLIDGSPMWISYSYNRGGDWRGPAGMGWEVDEPRKTAALPDGTLAEDGTGWGWEHITEIAYNEITKQVWIGSKSLVELLAKDHWNYFGQARWAWYGSGPATIILNGGAAGGADTILVPAEADEAIYNMEKLAGQAQWYSHDLFFPYYSDPVPTPMTGEIRFRINSYSTAPDPTYAAYIMRLGFAGPYGAAPNSPVAMVYFNGDTGHLELHQLNSVDNGNGTFSHTATVLADMGAITIGNWHEVRLIMDNDTTNVRAYVDGTEMFNGNVARYSDWFEGRFNFGPAVDVDEWAFGYSEGNELYVAGNDTAQVDFDYGAVAPGSEMVPPDNSAWLNIPADQGGHIAGFVGGVVHPELWYMTCIINRFDGDPANNGFFTEVDTANDRYFGPLGWSVWHMNNNFPGNSNKPNTGNYWCTALEVNPMDGSAYMSWSGDNGLEDNMYYRGVSDWGPVGNIYRISKEATTASDQDVPSNVLGAPQAGHPDSAKADNRSHVEDILFSGNKVYALVVDIETGEYNLFSADNPAEAGACCLPSGCQELSELGCLDAGGLYQGDGTTCATTSCEGQVCHDPFADADGDGDVDQEDFARFQACFTGDATGDPLGTYPPQNCECFDTDADGDVDGTDFTAFQNCASGPGIPADPNCD